MITIRHPVAAVVVLLAFCGAAWADDAKVLIIGIDGCRPDALLAAQTPNIDRLWRDGAFSFHATTDRITYSGPCWTSMLTGVWSDKHGIISNKYDRLPLSEFPHFFARIKQANPEIFTASIARWAPLHKILSPTDADVMLTPKTDRLVADAAVELLAQGDPDIAFVHFDDVDHAGHGQGYGPHVPAYVEAIETTDRLLGEIIDAIEARASFTGERWLIMVTTDHGGIGKGHGKNSPQENDVFLIIHGQPGVTGELLDRPATIDVAVTATAFLGIPIQPEWGMDGRIIGDVAIPSDEDD